MSRGDFSGSGDWVLVVVPSLGLLLSLFLLMLSPLLGLLLLFILFFAMIFLVEHFEITPQKRMLARLEELRKKGQISKDLYDELKREYEKQ